MLAYSVHDEDLVRMRDQPADARIRSAPTRWRHTTTTSSSSELNAIDVRKSAGLTREDVRFTVKRSAEVDESAEAQPAVRRVLARRMFSRTWSRREPSAVVRRMPPVKSGFSTFRGRMAGTFVEHQDGPAARPVVLQGVANL